MIAGWNRLRATRGRWRIAESLERRETVLIVSAYIGIATTIALGIVAALEQNTSLLITDLSLGGLLVIARLLYGFRPKYEAYALGGMIAVGAFLLFYMVDGGQDQTGFLPALVYPLILFYLVGPLRGVIVSGSFGLLAAAYFAMSGSIPFGADYDPSFTVRALAAYFLIAVFSLLFRRQTDRRERELLAAKQAAETASRARGAFLSNMSHELRTPLNHILGFAGLLTDRRTGPLSARQDEYVKDIHQSAAHLLRLIDGTLELTRLDSTGTEPRPALIALADPIRQALRDAGSNLHSRRIRLREDVSEELEAWADPEMTRAIMAKLLSNAVKFTPEEGSIRISGRHVTTDAGDFVEIEVSDSGIGIEAEDLERIFEPLRQLDDGTTKRFAGVGIGLTSARHLTAMMGGSIRAESDGPGSGSRFIVTLPTTP